MMPIAKNFLVVLGCSRSFLGPFDVGALSQGGAQLLKMQLTPTKLPSLFLKDTPMLS